MGFKFTVVLYVNHFEMGELFPNKILKSLFQLEFFEVSELSFAQDLIKGKEGMVKKLAGGDQKRTGLFKCIARGFRFIWSCFVGYV